MAYLPDEAIDASFEISNSAFRIYAYVCRRRNHARQYAWLSVENVTSALSLSKTTVYEAIAELEKLQWLTRKENCWYPRKGSFWPVDKRYLNKPVD